MAEVITIKLLCSLCTRNDYYYQLVEKIAGDLGLRYTIERITDEDEMGKYHLHVRCMFAYCPGCNALNGLTGSGASTMWAPALVINDQVALHGCVPSEQALEGILSAWVDPD